MSRQYKNPPIREAVCEIRFGSESAWDLAVPGLIYSALKDDFPRRIPNPLPIASASSRSGDPALLAQLDALVSQDISVAQGLRFWREESDDGVIVVAPNRISISHYPPYPSWEKFLPMITRILETYINEAKPSIIQRMGLRYINDIRFESTNVELEDYFELFPHLGPALPQDIRGFQMTLNFDFHDAKERMRVQLANAPTIEDGNVGIRLDLDYFGSHEEYISFEGAANWLEEAHRNIEDVFEGCLKEAARDLFN